MFILLQSWIMWKEKNQASPRIGGSFRPWIPKIWDFCWAMPQVGLWNGETREFTWQILKYLKTYYKEYWRWCGNHQDRTLANPCLTSLLENKKKHDNGMVYQHFLHWNGNKTWELSPDVSIFAPRGAKSPPPPGGTAKAICAAKRWARVAAMNLAGWPEHRLKSDKTHGESNLPSGNQT